MRPISSFPWMHPRIKLLLCPDVGCWHRSPLGGASPFYCQNGMYTRQSAFQAGFWVWIPSGEALPGFKPQSNLGTILAVSRISRGMPMWWPLSILCQFLFPHFSVCSCLRTYALTVLNWNAHPAPPPGLCSPPAHTLLSLDIFYSLTQPLAYCLFYSLMVCQRSRDWKNRLTRVFFGCWILRVWKSTRNIVDAQ